MNSTKVGGRAVAWVANRILGCLPPRTGGGVAATISLRNVLSWPVEMRAVPRRERALQGGHQLLHRTAGLGGDVHPLRPLHLRQRQVDLAVQQVAPVLVDQVPLVERQHQRPAGLDHHRQHPLVLLGQRLRRVDQDDDHLGGVDRAVRAHRGVELVPAGLPDLAAQTGGVDETPESCRPIRSASRRGRRWCPRRRAPPTARRRPAG